MCRRDRRFRSDPPLRGVRDRPGDQRGPGRRLAGPKWRQSMRTMGRKSSMTRRSNLVTWGGSAARS